MWYGDVTGPILLNAFFGQSEPQTATAGVAVATAVGAAPSASLTDPPQIATADAAIAAAVGAAPTGTVGGVTYTAEVAVATAGAFSVTASMVGGVQAALTATVMQGDRVIAVRVIPGTSLTTTLQTFTYALTDGERMGITDVDVTPLDVVLAWEPGSGAVVEVDDVALSIYPPRPVYPAQTATCEVAVASAVAITPDAAIIGGGQVATPPAAVATAVAPDAVSGAVRAPSLGPTQGGAVTTVWNGSNWCSRLNVVVDDADDRVLVRVGTNGSALSSVWFDGVEVTHYVTASDNNFTAMFVYDLPAPAAGTYLFEVRHQFTTFNSVVVANGVRGVDAVTPRRASVTGGVTNSTTASVNATSRRMDLVVDAKCASDPVYPTSQGVEFVGGWGDNARQFGFGHKIATGTSTNMQWTLAASDWSNHVAFAYVAVSTQVATCDAAVASAVAATPSYAVGPLTGTTEVAVASAVAADATGTLGGGAQTATSTVAVATAGAKNAVSGGVRAPYLGPTHAVTMTRTWNGSAFVATTSFTVDAEDDRVLIRMISDNVTPTVKFDGVTLTAVLNASDGNSSNVLVYDLAAPAAGTYTIETRSGSGGTTRTVVNGVRGVDTTTPTRTASTAGNSYANTTVTATTERMDLVASVAVHEQPIRAGDNMGADDVGMLAAGRYYGAGHLIATGTSTSATWIEDADGFNEHILLPYVPVSAFAQTATGDVAVATALAPAPTVVLGGLTATTTVATATAVGAAPTFTIGARTATAAAAVGTAVAAAPSIALGAVSRTAGVAVAAAVVPAPVVVLGGLTATTTAAVATAVVPAPATSSGTVATTTVAQATAVGAQASVSLGAVSRTAGVAVGSAVALAPTITVGSVTRSAEVAVATAIAATPMVTVGAVSRTVGAAVASAIALTPTLVIGGRTATAGVATATGTALGASWSSVLTAPAGAAVATAGVWTPEAGNLSLGSYLNGVQWVVSRYTSTLHVGPRYGAAITAQLRGTSGITITPRYVGGLDASTRVTSGITATPRYTSAVTVQPRLDASITFAASEAAALTLQTGEP